MVTIIQLLFTRLHTCIRSILNALYTINFQTWIILMKYIDWSRIWNWWANRIPAAKNWIALAFDTIAFIHTMHSVVRFFTESAASLSIETRRTIWQIREKQILQPSVIDVHSCSVTLGYHYVLYVTIVCNNCTITPRPSKKL